MAKGDIQQTEKPRKIKVGWLRRWAIGLTFGILRGLVMRIRKPLLRQWVSYQLDPLQDVTDVMTDKNPRNMEQLEEVWDKHKKDYATKNVQVVRAFLEEKVKDPNLLATIREYSDKLQILIDDNL